MQNKTIKGFMFLLYVILMPVSPLIVFLTLLDPLPGRKRQSTGQEGIFPDHKSQGKLLTSMVQGISYGKSQKWSDPL